MIAVCRLADLSPGDVRVVEGADGPIAVVCADGHQLFAIDDSCTHQRTPLSDGWLEGVTVECPLHGSSFDLRSGTPTGPPATQPVRTHDVVVQEGQVFVVPANAD